MPNQIPPKNPIDSTNQLALALRVNTLALHAVRRRYRWLVGLVLALILFFCFTVKVRYDTRIEFCHRDNEMRGGLLNVADSMEEAATSDNPTRDAFIAELRRDFALRDCGDVGWLA